MDSERLLVQTNDGRRNGIVYEFDEKARYRLILDMFHRIHTSSPRPRCLAFALLSPHLRVRKELETRLPYFAKEGAHALACVKSTRESSKRPPQHPL